MNKGNGGAQSKEKNPIKGKNSNKIIEKHFPKQNKKMLIKVQDVHRAPNRQDQKRDFPWHVIIKTLNIQNNSTEKEIQISKGKEQVT